MADGYGQWWMIVSDPSVHSHQPLAISHVSDLFRRAFVQVPELLSLPPVQSRGNRERRVHPHNAGVEIQFGHALEAARRTLLDAYPAAFAVIHQDLVQAVRAIVSDDARLRADQIAVVARVA